MKLGSRTSNTYNISRQHEIELRRTTDLNLLDVIERGSIFCISDITFIVFSKSVLKEDVSIPNFKVTNLFDEGDIGMKSGSSHLK